MTERIVSLVEFEELAKEAKLDLLYKDGVYVGKRKWNGLHLILFQLYNFYVEVHYKKYRREIDHLLLSADAAILQPYLDQIHVRDLDRNDH